MRLGKKIKDREIDLDISLGSLGLILKAIGRTWGVYKHYVQL